MELETITPREVTQTPLTWDARFEFSDMCFIYGAHQGHTY